MRTFKKILFWTGLSFFLLIASAIVVTMVYADEVKEIVKNSLSKQIERDVFVKDLEFSLFRKFPRASVTLNGVVVKGPTTKAEDFVKAEQVHLSFNLFDVFSEDVTIKEVFIEDATTFIHRKKDGSVNYKVFREDTSGVSESKILSIEAIHLVNTKARYLDDKIDFDLNAHSYNSTVSLSLSKDKKVACDWDGEILSFGEGDFRIDRLPFKGPISLVVTDSVVSYQLTDGVLYDNHCSVKGNYHFASEKNELSYSIEKAEIQKYLGHLDEVTKNEFSAKQLAGVLDASGVVISDKKGTSLNGEYHISEGQFAFSDNQVLSGILLQGKYEWPDVQRLSTATFHVKEMKGVFEEHEVQLSGKIADFKRLKVDVKVKGELSIPSLFSHLSDDTLKVASGKLLLDTKLKGQLGDVFRAADWSKIKNVTSDGSIEVQDFSFSSYQIQDQFQDVKAQLRFDSRRVLLNEVSGVLNGAKFQLQGHVIDYLGALFEGKALHIAAKVKMDEVQMEQFMDSGNDGSNDAYYFEIPDNIKLALQAQVKQFSFKDFHASDVAGSLNMGGSHIQLQGIRFKSCEGKLRVDALIREVDEQTLSFKGQINSSELNVKQAFKQTGNFGQDFLTWKHLKGAFSANTLISGTCSRALVVDYKKLFVQSNLTIIDGEIRDLETLAELERYLKESFDIPIPLQNLKFEKLSNTVEVSNEMIRIPEMKIASNAMKLSMEGTHGFDQKIDYLFKIKHGQIFKAKHQNKIDLEYGVVDHSDNTATLPLRMKGTVDDPVFSYDVKAKSKIVKENWKKEKVEVKEAIKQEIREILGKDTAKKPVETKTKIKVVWDEE